MYTIKLAIIVLITIAGFSACESQADVDKANKIKIDSEKDNSYDIKCINGVSYLKYDYGKFRSGYFGMTVMLDRDSKIIHCKNLGKNNIIVDFPINIKIISGRYKKAGEEF